MRELELFEQYLLRLRQEKLQQSHAAAIGASSFESLLDIRAKACEAEFAVRIMGGLKVLKEDPGEFIKRFLT